MTLFKQIVTPTQKELLLQIPAELINHPIEILIFPCQKDEQSLQEKVDVFFDRFNFKLEKFNRDDLYDR